VEFSQGLMRKIRELQGPFVKQNFPLIYNPNEEMPKTKVGEFFKLYNIALGSKFKNSKFVSLHGNLRTKVGLELLLS
jgi:hypothetical protein